MKSRTLVYAFLTFCFVLAGTVGAAHAATYYVSPNGNDSSSGTQSSPFRTVNRGVRALNAGDTLLVRGGIYPESLMRTIPAGTSWDSKVRVAAYPGETVWLAPDGAANVLSFGLNSERGQQQAYIEIDGINLDGTRIQNDIVKVNWADGWYAHHIRVQNAELRGRNDSPNSPIQGILLTGADNLPVTGGNEFINLRILNVGRTRLDQAIYIQSPNNLVDGCEIVGHASGGIEIYNGYHGAGVPTGNVIRNNRIHHGATISESVRGILIAGNNNLVYNNIISDLPARGMEDNALWIYAGSGNLVANNTLSRNAGFGLVVGYDYPVPSNTVRNNLVVGSGQGDYWNRNSTGTTSDHNLFGVDGRFMNAGGGDFRLQADSPAIDAGTLLSVVDRDRDGNRRPSGSTHDIGAYEFGGTSSSSTGAPPPPTNVRIVSN